MIRIVFSHQYQYLYATAIYNGIDSNNKSEGGDSPSFSFSVEWKMCLQITQICIHSSPSPHICECVYNVRNMSGC
jgi:hypothetical protein